MSKCYIISCRTGCSCCSYDNHYRGPYHTKEEAESRIKRFMSGKDYPLASQYAKYGNYYVEEVEVETISNGRMIIDDKVHPEFFVEVSLKTGELLNVKDDYFYSYD